MKRLFLSVYVFATLVVSATSQILSEGMKFPEIMLASIDGDTLKAEDLKGKVVFYNFYFAICQPCIAQKEGLNELYETFAGDDVLFIAITFDGYEQIKWIRETHGMRFKIVSIYSDEIERHFGVRNYPTNFLVGIDGRILKMKRGIKSFETANQEILDEFSPAIQSELQKLKPEK